MNVWFQISGASDTLGKLQDVIAVVDHSPLINEAGFSVYSVERGFAFSSE